MMASFAYSGSGSAIYPSPPSQNPASIDPTAKTSRMDLLSKPSGFKTWPAKKKALLVTAVLVVLIALGVALGVGLGLGLNDDEGEEGETGIWQPAIETSWQIVLRYALNDTSVDVDVYDIDLFDNHRDMISELHYQGRRVICYFSAGTYENWREDADRFPDSAIGKRLRDWQGESWIDISAPAVREIMTDRLDLAAEKGCDGVDPDNVDGYDNDNGLGLTQDDTVSYMRFLAREARRRNLSIGLKNAGDVIPRVIGEMQWSVNEQCAQYNECDVYAAFIAQGKPVFHIEYPKGMEVNNEVEVSGERKAGACEVDDAAGFSTVIKNMQLDNWVQEC